MLHASPYVFWCRISSYHLSWSYLVSLQCHQQFLQMDITSLVHLNLLSSVTKKIWKFDQSNTVITTRHRSKKWGFGGYQVYPPQPLINLGMWHLDIVCKSYKGTRFVSRTGSSTEVHNWFWRFTHSEDVSLGLVAHLGGPPYYFKEGLPKEVILNMLVMKKSTFL